MNVEDDRIVSELCERVYIRLGEFLDISTVCRGSYHEFRIGSDSSIDLNSYRWLIGVVPHHLITRSQLLHLVHQDWIYSLNESAVSFGEAFDVR